MTTDASNDPGDFVPSAQLFSTPTPTDPQTSTPITPPTSASTPTTTHKIATPGSNLSDESINPFQVGFGREDTPMRELFNGAEMVDAQNNDLQYETQAPDEDVEMSYESPATGDMPSGIGGPVDAPALATPHVDRSSSRIDGIYRIVKSRRDTSMRAGSRSTASRQAMYIQAVAEMNQAGEVGVDSRDAGTEADSQVPPAPQDPTPQNQQHVAPAVAIAAPAVPAVQIAAPIPSEVVNAFNTGNGTMPRVYNSPMVSPRGPLSSLVCEILFDKTGVPNIAEISNEMRLVLGDRQDTRRRPHPVLETIFLTNVKIDKVSKIAHDGKTASAFLGLGAVSSINKMTLPKGLGRPRHIGNRQIQAAVSREMYASKQFFFSTVAAWRLFERNSPNMLQHMRVLHLGFEPKSTTGDFILGTIRNMGSLQRLVFHGYQGGKNSMVEGMRITMMFEPMWVRLTRAALVRSDGAPINSTEISGAVKVLAKEGADNATYQSIIAVETKIMDEVKIMLDKKGFPTLP